MKHLLENIRRALAGVARAPLPPPASPSGAAALEGGEDLPTIFATFFERAAGRLVPVADRSAAEAWIEREYTGRTICRIEDAPSEEALRASDVGVDRADFLIAETGTIVRSYTSRRASRVSLVPPTTVFLAHVDELVRDLPQALARLADAHRAGRAWSILVTGPSRTADIEKQLVIPAHGPREVVVLLLGDDQR
jgi:L-lactate utilization protein LutC